MLRTPSPHDKAALTDEIAALWAKGDIRVAYDPDPDAKHEAPPDKPARYALRVDPHLDALPKPLSCRLAPAPRSSAASRKKNTASRPDASERLFPPFRLRSFRNQIASVSETTA